MLFEIICNEFRQQRIEFHSGLNTVLGTTTGNNSIGKSSFLMIVDFVFGGNTYAHATDIIRSVGHHDIYFSFVFEEKQFWFIRDTLDHQKVWKCNNTYKKEEELALDEYCTWLNKKYELELPYLSFRDAVGRYIRVYGKENLNEKQPLHAASNEKSQKASYALLKLFDLYMSIHNLEKQHNISKEAVDTFKKAQKHHFVASVTKRQVDYNIKEIEVLTTEIEQIAVGLEKGFTDLDAELSDEAIRIKQLLSRARRQRSSITAKLKVIEENLSYRFSTATDDFNKLKKFFPDTNLAALSEVETFHRQISSVFSTELQSEKRRLQKEVTDISLVISEYELQLENLIQNPKLSKTILSRHADLQRQIRVLKEQNDSYSKLTQLKQTEKEDNERLKTVEIEQFACLEKEMNSKMEQINNTIYSGTYNAPILKFGENKYTFFTPDDTGTGIAYKGLIVFDLSVLALTKLPLLVHDSVLLKQISDEAIEKILELYENQKKQVIIALDKQDSYTKASQSILNKNAVLKLSTNGEQLFGRSWG
ncbi:uncharacterized protein YydD (DUF2326 family) [Anaerospora hongkongensis]|uniref:Uncharacterized protein YydD (DUF2326 family) n=1 Tax=Anaerospora hongkongensis TaxID=244830 RepID=A0A4R1Q8M9_9FIRM|nr:DUF2326 domain-containing protein [Anaerospora hongkongensis]TCL38075.1 uncharacterized protein YydD (DUF2326 family) [Anaerospora hongkongensis]